MTVASFRAEVDFGGDLELSLWYTAAGKPFAISCYLWCTSDGSLPSDDGVGSQYGLSPVEIVSNGRPTRMSQNGRLIFVNYNRSMARVT